VTPHHNAGDGSSEDEEGEEMGGFAFVAQGQTPVSGQPGHRSLDDPAMSAEFGVGVDAFAGDADTDAAVDGAR
jgi:hypothetical protein